MLNQKYAVIDLETTGNNPKKDKILELGVVFIENGQIVNEYSTFFCDTNYISPFISELTNITIDMIEDAPKFSEKAEEIYKMIESCSFVAHNVGFDLTFLKNAFKSVGIDYNPMHTLDTVTLSKILLPREHTYQLAPLTESLGIELKSAHRAKDDALATAHLLIRLFQKLQSINRHTKIMMYKIVKSLNSDIASLLFSSISTSNLNDDDLIRVGDLMIKKSQQKNCDTKNYKIETLYKNFLKYKGFSHRKEQLELIYIIYDALKHNKKIAVEAYTGLGKSEAMLIASIVYSDETNNQVLISTSRKLLQNQLFFSSLKDLLLSSEIENYNITMLKGRQNYVDLEVVNRLLSLVNDNQEIMMLKLKLLVWLQETDSGDLSEIDLKGPERLYYMTALNQNSHKNEYFYMKALDSAKTSNLVITNHYYLFECLDEINIEHLVIDEAHQLQKAIERSSKEVYKYSDLKFIMSQIGLDKKDQLLTDYLRQNATQNGQFIDAIITEINEQIDFIFKALNKNKIDTAVGHVSDSLERIQIIIQMILGTNDYQHLFNYLHNYQIKLSKIKKAIKKNNYEIHSNKNYTLSEFVLIKDNVEDLYAEASKITSQVLISGTLEVKGDFKHLNKWFQNHEFDTYIIRSESLFQDVDLFIPNDIHDFKDVDNYLLDMIDYLKILIENKNEKVMVIFTSYDLLNEMYEFMMDTELFVDLPVLRQTPKITPNKLLIQYNQLSRCILLATSSFTEGINIENTEEKIMFLTKLPFPVPKKSDFKNFYNKDLPEAVFNFRQILGRLKRNDTDKGKIVLFDKRLLTKSYRHAFLKYFKDENIKTDDRHVFIDWLTDS